MTFRLVPFALAAVFLVGCNRSIQNESAVRQGVIDSLSTKSDLNLTQMQVDVTAVSFRQDEADATVSFRPKGSAPGGSGMQMRYTLERKGNRWVVKGRGQGHGAGQMGGGQMGGGGQLPPGHPSLGAGTPPATPQQTPATPPKK